MAKKFGKIILTTAAISAVAACAFCYFKKKDKDLYVSNGSDDDYDDFSDDLDDDAESSRTYVSLSADAEEGTEASTEDAPAENGFTSLAEQIAQAADKMESTVEDFFDEDATAEESK